MSDQLPSREVPQRLRINHGRLVSLVADDCGLKQSTVQRVLAAWDQRLSTAKRIVADVEQRREHWEFEVTGVVDE